MDWMEQERERGITIPVGRHHGVLARMAGNYPEHRINIIDTPGAWTSPSWVELDAGARLACLHGLRLGGRRAAAVRDGLAPGHRHYGVPRIAFVNKMDRVGADFFRVQRQIVERFLEGDAVPIQIRSAPRTISRGVVDLVR